MKILLEKTDEENSITLNQMIAELERYGITAERKPSMTISKLCAGMALTLPPGRQKLLTILWQTGF